MIEFKKGKKMEDIKPCPVCGKQAKVRYRMPYTWIECKKKCTMSGYYIDWDEQCDPKARSQAISDWNAIPRKNN